MKVFRRRFGGRITDNVGACCDCLECRAADVTHLARVRVPPDDLCSTPRWLHGSALRAWHEARETGLAAVRAQLHRPSDPGRVHGKGELASRRKR